MESTADGRSLASPHLSDGSTGPSCCERKPLYLCKASWFHVKKTYPSGLCFALPCASFIQLQKPGISPLLSSTVNQQFREQTGVNLHTAPRSVKGHTQALMPNFLDRSGKGNHPKNGSPAVIDVLGSTTARITSGVCVGTKSRLVPILNPLLLPFPPPSLLPQNRDSPPNGHSALVRPCLRADGTKARHVLSQLLQSRPASLQKPTAIRHLGRGTAANRLFIWYRQHKRIILGKHH